MGNLKKLHFTIYFKKFGLFTFFLSDNFAKILSGGELGAKYSIKTDKLNFDDIEHAIDYIRSYFSLTVVEIVDNSASLYSSSIQNHPICILVKYLVRIHFLLN